MVYEWNIRSLETLINSHPEKSGVEFDPYMGPILRHCLHWYHISALLSGQAEATHLFKGQEMFHNHVDSIIEDECEPSVEKLF